MIVTDYTIQRINGSDAFVSTGTSVVMSNSLSMWKNKAKKIDCLTNDVFGHDQCCLSPASKRCLAMFSQTNSGGSNEATLMVVAAA